jgi:drug/metabolite transporter (DMT)-like permease
MDTPIQDDNRRSTGQGRVLLAFAAVTLIWGTTWIVIKDQLGVVPASWSVTYRFLLGSAVMFGVALITRERLWLDAKAARFVALFGIAQFCFNFNFVYRAEHYITSGLVAVVFALLFVPNTLFARLFLGQEISRRFMAGSAVALAGIALLFVKEAQGDAAAQSATLTGIAFTLAGVLSASTANVMQASETARRLSMVVMLAWGMLCGSLIDAAWAWYSSGPPVIELRLGYALGLLYLGAIASALAFTLYFWTIRQLGPGKAAYSSVVIPIIAMGISTVAEGYQWTALSVAGGVLALAGMVIALGRR